MTKLIDAELIIEEKERAMTLISREDAIEVVAKQWLFEASTESPYVNDDDIGEYRNLAEGLFEDVPTVKAEPIKHGTWTIAETYDCEGGEIPRLICSECKSEPMAWSSKRFFNYCPNCGAKMKGQEE